MSHIDTAFKLGTLQAHHDYQIQFDKCADAFQDEINRLALAPSESIGQSRPSANGPSAAQNMSAMMGMGAGRMGQSTENINMTSPVGGQAQPGQTTPSPTLASLGTSQAGGSPALKTPAWAQSGAGPAAAPAATAGTSGPPATGASSFFSGPKPAAPSWLSKMRNTFPEGIG